MRAVSRFASLSALPLFWAQSAYAQNFQIITNIPGCNFTTGEMTAKCIPLFIAHLIQLVFGLISILFVLNVIYAGYEIALGYGSPEADKARGKNRLVYSIIGIIVTVCAFLILDLVVSIIAP